MKALFMRVLPGLFSGSRWCSGSAPSGVKRSREPRWEAGEQFLINPEYQQDLMRGGLYYFLGAACLEVLLSTWHWAGC